MTVEAAMHGMGFLEAARTPARRLAEMREIRRSADAEARLGRLADLGSLFGSSAGRRHLDSLTELAAPASGSEHSYVTE
ncbi:MAG: hypothetical protein LBT40_12290 [Deltaproteobacteria bacterium]|jgi:hypothetical protein|nr:hypothetical protein [Deltaproteobacteria bacterium]